MYDIIIIGAGPAGISAGIYAVSRGKRTLILEQTAVGGLLGKVSTVTHYSGIVEQETGATFSARLERQARAAGVEIRFEAVTEVSLKGEYKRITTASGQYEAPKVILASGSRARRLGIPGEEELAGRGMGLNAARDGASYAGRNLYVVGGADGAVKEALYLAQFAKKLTIIHFEDQLGCIPEFRRKVEGCSNIELKLGCRLHEVHGRKQEEAGAAELSLVDSLELVSEKDGRTETIQDPGCGIFVYAGVVPNTELYTELTLDNGYIPVNEKMETELPGVYAAGDIRVKQVRQAATAVADGAIAGINAAM